MRKESQGDKRRSQRGLLNFAAFLADNPEPTGPKPTVRTVEGKMPPLGVHGDEVDLPLEGSDVELEPDAFHTLEEIHRDDLGFTPEQAREATDRYATSYYGDIPEVRANTVIAVKSLITQFRPPETEATEL